MKTILLGIVAVLSLAVPGVSNAQDRVRLEFAPGALFATEDFADADLGTGFGAGVNLSVRVLPHLAPYVGWSWRHLTADTSFAGSEIDVEETGYAFGLRFEHPLARGGPALMLRVGGTYAHIELESASGDLVADSGHGAGWEAGTGLAFRLGDRWHLTPMVTFRSLKRDIDIGSSRTPVTLRYVAAEVGFSRSF